MLSINATALVVFAIVWILVLILSRIFFKPILRVLDERAARIAKDKEAAEAARQATEADLKRIEEGLKEARAAADAIRNAAEAEALKDRSRLVREVQAEGRAEVEKAKAELARQTEALKKELDDRTEEIAGTIEKRILGE
jgi:F-type H+-transporting ATPase subunit b